MSNAREEDLINDGALSPDDFHKFIERINEVAEYRLEVPINIREKLEVNTSDILIDPETALEAASALITGHLVLQGPPGTGKSTLARALAKAFHCNIFPVTAHDDWTTYEVIGRQSIKIDEHGGEEVIPENGYFTEAVIRCAGNIVRHFDRDEEPQATWLLIDELNRAHIDKAFGELFTVLGTDEVVPITLSFQKKGNQVLVTPRRFRIIATLNSLDRQFVNSLSQGLKRRFSFISVDIPPKRHPGETWESGNSLAVKEFSLVFERAINRLVNQGMSMTDEERILFVENCAPSLSNLFNLVELVRYSEEGNDIPYLPIGTAHLIDTIELFLQKTQLIGAAVEAYPDAIDWATSIKIAPLFDTDTIIPQSLRALVRILTPPFNNRFKHELMQIISAGQFYVK